MNNKENEFCEEEANKQFDELGEDYKKELLRQAKERAKKKNQDMLEEVRYVHPDGMTETEKLSYFWQTFKPKVGLEWVLASKRAVKKARGEV